MSRRQGTAWILDARICWVVLVTFSCLCLIPVESPAALVPSRLADGLTASERAEQIETIRQTLQRELVSQRLADYGLSAREIADKLPTLSDEQLHQMAGLSKDIAAGGTLEAVVAVLLIIFLVVVILKLMDKEVIIK